MNTKSLRVAILQTGRTPERLRARYEDYDVMCRQLVGLSEGQAQSFAVFDGDFPANVVDFDAFVITGSAHGVYESHSWIEPLMALIRAAMAANRKLIGICFGHQIIAQALGGLVEKSGKGLGAGRLSYDYVDETGAKSRISLNAWHQDQVISAPINSKVIASSAFCPIAALAYDNRAITFQAHPEFSDAFITDLIQDRRGTSLTDAAADHALASIEDVADADRIADRIRKFLAAPVVPW